ncbi:MAG: nitroreductase family protein [Rubricoccaceae bacterium]
MTDTPHAAPRPAELETLIGHAVRAPSVLNTQPWQFVVEGSTIHLHADRSRQLAALDPNGRELTISCGAALFYLRTAAQHAGWSPEVAVRPDAEAPDRLASITLRPGSSPRASDRMFRALSVRSTNRLPFSSEPIPSGALEAMMNAAGTHGTELHVFDSESQRARLAELVSQGVLKQSQDEAIVADIQAWLRPTSDPRPDGVRDVDQGAWDRHAMMRTPPSSVAAYKARLVREAPAVLVLSTATEDPNAWLSAGQALAHALVVAADHGLAASYANEPIEVNAVRKAVAALVDGRVPQILFRVGIPDVEPHTPRRRATDVISQGT